MRQWHRGAKISDFRIEICSSEFSEVFSCGVVVDLTIIAIGTSLPELATCVAAAIRSQHDISIGNLVGSNIFNTLLVTGTAGTIRPFENIASRLAAGSDYWIMIAVSAAFAALAVLGRRVISRLAGSILLCTYIAYMIYLFAFSR